MYGYNVADPNRRVTLLVRRRQAIANGLSRTAYIWSVYIRP